MTTITESENIDSDHIDKKLKTNPETMLPIILRISNLNKNIYQKDFTKLLNNLNIIHLKSKKPPKQDFATIHFSTIEDQEACRKALTSLEIKGKIITVADYVPVQRPYVPRTLDPSKTPHEQLADQTTPLWRLTYPLQLEQKNINFMKTLGKLRKKLYDLLPKPHELTPEAPNLSILQRSFDEIQWIRDSSKQFSGLPCELLEFSPSPLINYYRNKCEFTFGVDFDNNITLGFLLGTFKEGVTTVLGADQALHVKPEALAIVSHVQEFARNSNMPVYDRTTKQGFWRLVLLRTFDSGDKMIMIQVNSTSVSPESLMDLKKQLVDSFDKSNLGLKSIFFQESDNVFNGFKEETPIQLLSGEHWVYESLLGLKFRVSPTAFFQVNTPAASELYSKVAQWFSKDEDSSITQDKSNVVLLDLCCGTGTIGLTMAKHVKKVIGVEMIKEAIDDAIFNAKLNEIDNVVYLHSKVEEAIQTVFKEHVQPQDEVVAILDPPRSGVHSCVIQAIRACKELKRVIYISCDADAALGNFVELTRPSSKRYNGTPFRPVRAQGFDLFPHTKHAELVIEFVRELKVTETEKKVEILNEEIKDDE